MAGGKTNAMENDWLNYEFRAVAYTPPATHYVGGFTVSPTSDAGTGGTEVTGGAYARQGITRASGSWNAPAGAGITNVSAVTYAVATANQGRWKALGIFDAITGGNLREVIPMVVLSTLKNFSVDDTTNNDISMAAHGFSANDIVRFFAVGGTLPSPLTEDTLYYVISTGLATDTFRVSTTLGGSVVDITTAGGGECAKDASFDVVTNSQLSFAAGQIAIQDE